MPFFTHVLEIYDPGRTLIAGGQWVLDPCAVEESLGASVSLCFLEGRWLVFHQALRGAADLMAAVVNDQSILFFPSK